MQSPFFSIIIPTYNAGKTIEACLKSIIDQSFSNFEVLILDGLSTDDTIAIAKFFEDKRIKVFSEKDEGVYDAMNKGVQGAKGEWLLFLGSDDKLFDQFVLEKISRILVKTKSHIVYGNVMIAGNPTWASNNQIYDGYFSLGKLLEKNICHQAIFYKRKIFDRIGNYSLAYKICADFDFNLRCFANYKFQYVDLIISIFSATGNSSFLVDHKFMEDVDINIIKYFNFQIIFKKEFIEFFQRLRQIIFRDLKKYSLKEQNFIRLLYYILHFKVKLLKLKSI